MSSLLILSSSLVPGTPSPPVPQPPPPPSPVTPPGGCPPITVGPATLPNGTVGVGYSQPLTASGGTGPYTFTFAGVLPFGLRLTPSGLLSGVPMTPGATTVAIRATDANGCFNTLLATVLISATAPSPCPTIVVSPSSLPRGTVGTPYSQSMSASGGQAPYAFASLGALPPGLTLTSAGLLSGTPTVATAVALSLVATDANGCTGTLVVAVTIQAAPPVVITIAPATLPGGTVGTPYSHAFSASGGTAPYTFALLSGVLPTGLSLASNGTVSGTPSAATTDPVTVQATDAHGATGSLATTLTTVAAGSQRILGVADISYLGCFRMPPGTDTRYSFGNLTGRVVGGQTHLFVYGINPIQNDPVLEIIDPGSYSLDYHTAPYATLYANWGDIYHGKRITFDANGNPQPVGQQVPGGLYWNDQTQLLYWTYYNSYNVTSAPDWGLGASQLIDPVAATSYSYGPWRTKATDADGHTWYGPWRCLYLWANPFDGSFLCGSSIQSGASASPWGPDMYGGLPWPTITTPTGPNTANDLVLPTRSLESYFMGDPNAPNRISPASTGAVVGSLRSFRRRLDQALYEFQGLQANPALNGGVGSFGQCDRTTGAIWLNLTHVRGIIFSNVLAGAVSQLTTDPNAGHSWYCNAGVNPPIGACAHGFGPPFTNTGPVTRAAFPHWAIYNPDDLAAVMNTANDYTPEPVSEINLETTYGIQTAPITTQGGAKNLCGFYFDPVRKYLFCVAHDVDDTQGSTTVLSIIHVFAVNDVP